uniref:Uncharacterized protein n=1 Tax=Amphimedon queenslandica TaxID=400682 RepID=A0A1X7U271_AMPQE
MICYAFLFYFLLDNMESIIPGKAIQHRLYFSEYRKSRILNKDSRFHRNHSYCLHYYGLKIDKAIKTGIYNLLKHQGAMLVKLLLK